MLVIYISSVNYWSIDYKQVNQMKLLWKDVIEAAEKENELKS